MKTETNRVCKLIAGFDMEYDMLIRKKYLKVQDRLGMRIGIHGGTKKMPVPRTVQDVLKILRELYNIGLKAYILPKEFFSKIKVTTDLYTTYYGELLKIKDIANKYDIELSIEYPNLPDPPDETLKIFITIASVMGCRMFIVRPDFYPMVPQDQALRLTVYKINEIVSEVNAKAKIGMETAGKIDELGSLEDIVEIAKRTRETNIVINWGNIHARGSGSLRTTEDFDKVVKKVSEGIGVGYFREAFFIFGGVSYGPSGLVRKIPIKNCDMKLEDLIKQIMTYGMRGTLILDDPGKEQFTLQILDRLADTVR
ncbi:MAG: hypothetical protein ISS36_00665 [Candidatus Aenigmarchaeota archaeon]|nr:hypothetical protein [Candidatus Aenigmarchaeota archaeon]